MSRGEDPIVVPEENVEIHSDSVKVSGKLGTLVKTLMELCFQRRNQLIVKRNSESKGNK